MNNDNLISPLTYMIPPINFRLYQSIRFNRPVDKEKDFISPGGYMLKMREADGTLNTVQFDFEEYEGYIDMDDPCVIHCIQMNADYNTFEGLNTITWHMLANVTEVEEWFIYTGEPGDGNPLYPVEIMDAIFRIIDNSTGRDIHFAQTPVTIPIKPSCSFPKEWL